MVDPITAKLFVFGAMRLRAIKIHSSLRQTILTNVDRSRVFKVLFANSEIKDAVFACSVANDSKLLAQVGSATRLYPGISRDDIIEVENVDGWYFFKKIVHKSGWSTIKLTLTKKGVKTRVELVSSLKESGIEVEALFEDFLLMSMPANVEYSTAANVWKIFGEVTLVEELSLRHKV